MSIKGILLTLCILSSTNVLAEAAHRLEIRNLKDRPDRLIQATAFVMDGKVFTAAHNIEDGDILIHTEIGLIRCDVEKKDKDIDVVILNPRIKIEDSKSDKDGCFASVKGKAVTRLKTDITSLTTAVIKGFDRGGSGSPVYRNGVIIGMVYAYTRDEDGNERKDDCRMIPIEVINKIKNSI